jgi:hypothetical protein
MSPRDKSYKYAAVWVGNDADGMPIIANFEIMEYDPETPEESTIKIVDIW